jgi:hypothetical protein
MQAKSSGASCDDSLNLTNDLRDQRVTLTHVLTIHPTHLAIPDLVRELTAGSEEFTESDNFERAIRDLTGADLLCCPGGVVMPTRAALHCDRLGLL